MRIITKQQASCKEEWVVASLLESPHFRWPANLCTALACAPLYWENPVAARIAVAIVKSIANPTKANIAMNLGPRDAQWLRHPSFTNGLPIALAEIEAEDLVAFYRAKRLSDVLGDAYQRAVAKPDRAKEIASKLMEDLEVFV
jgi:hypothetical protein